MNEPLGEPIQHPITKLGFFIEYTTSWLPELREASRTLEEARAKPHVLLDDDVAHIRRVYAEQAGDLVLFEDTAARWAAGSDLSEDQRTGLKVLQGNLAELRELNTSIRELAEYLAPRTLDRVLATPDMELGLNFLLAQVMDKGPGTTS